MARSGRSRAALKGWETRRAAARERSERSIRGWETRRRHIEHAAREHGRRARERTEKRLEPSVKAQRTKAANALEKEIARARRSEAAKRGHRTRAERAERQEGGAGGFGGGSGAPGGIYNSLDDLDYDLDEGYDYYDIETSPDYEED